MFMKSDSDIYIQVAEKKCGLIINTQQNTQPLRSYTPKTVARWLHSHAATWRRGCVAMRTDGLKKEVYYFVVRFVAT